MTTNQKPDTPPQAGLFVVPKQEPPPPNPPRDFVAAMAEILARLASEKAA